MDSAAPVASSVTAAARGSRRRTRSLLLNVASLAVFVVFSVWYLGEPIRWNHLAGFTLIAGGAFLVFGDFGVVRA